MTKTENAEMTEETTLSMKIKEVQTYERYLLADDIEDFKAFEGYRQAHSDMRRKDLLGW